jgi:NADPH:quinone reductase-like Zn-dependent oxidoreductase
LTPDEVVVPARNAVRADPLQLAMLPINPATAHLLLTRYVALQPGDWIGQNLGNSAGGQYVIAMAKKAGYRTVVVDGAGDATVAALAQLLEFGGTVVSYSSETTATRRARRSRRPTASSRTWSDRAH